MDEGVIGFGNAVLRHYIKYKYWATKKPLARKVDSQKLFAKLP